MNEKSNEERYRKRMPFRFNIDACDVLMNELYVRVLLFMWKVCKDDGV